MTDKLRVFGIDPGPVPGIAMLHYVDGLLAHANLLQGTWPVALEVLPTLITNGTTEWPMTLLAVERFVARGRLNADQRTTAQIADMVELIGIDQDIAVLKRNASQVKAWATDRRLGAVAPRGGKTLHALATGMPHARDAARHAIFAASHDGLVPDPLSKSNQQGARA